MEKKIQDLENRIRLLESKGNLQSEKQFDERVIFKNGVVIENGYLLLRSSYNKEGFRITTGNAYTNAGIAAEQGVLPDGSLYISKVTLQWPLFVKFNGTWTQYTLP